MISSWHLGFHGGFPPPLAMPQILKETHHESIDFSLMVIVRAGGSHNPNNLNSEISFHSCVILTQKWVEFSNQISSFLLLLEGDGREIIPPIWVMCSSWLTPGFFPRNFLEGHSRAPPVAESNGKALEFVVFFLGGGVGIEEHGENL